METNPYQSPTVTDTPVTAGDSAQEAMRRKHLRHESSIRLIGLLYLIAGVSFSALVFMLLGEAMLSSQIRVLWVAAVLACVPVLQISLGIGLRRLKPWTIVPVTIFSLLGLMAFPVGTLINGYVLWLLHSSAGKTVFSADYQAIIPLTRQVRVKTPLAVKLALVVIAVVTLAIITFGVLMTSTER